MVSSNSSADFITSLNTVASLLNRYLCIFIFIFGLIGNILNILVLKQRTLRSNPCAFFFLVSSIASLIVLISGLTSRMMSGYGADLTLTVGWICKVRNVVLYGARTLALWFIASAMVDRWLSSSVIVRRRALSNLKNARRSVIVLLVYTCLINAPIIFCYEANLTGALRGCYGSTYACRQTTDLIYAFGSVLIPLLLMVVFGLLSIRNVRKLKNRVQGVDTIQLSVQNKNTTNRSLARKKDQHLFKMLLAQVSLLCLFACPHALQKVYSSFATSLPVGSVESAVQSLVFTLLTLFAFLASGMTFYIYTWAGGSIFRKALLNLIHTFTRKILCH